MAHRERLAVWTTWLTALVVLGILAGLVVRRQGNLAWDDADYLRRGLTNVRLAASAGVWWVVPRALGRVFLEQPKPPWLVAWIELGALVFSRRHLGALILHASVVPYAFLLIAVVVIGRRLGGVVAGLLALICLVASPYSLAFGGKVMVETYLSLWLLLTYGLASTLLVRPSRIGGAALGLVIGLALLTKLTIVLFLPSLVLYLFVSAVRRESARQALLRPLLWSGVICIAVAGPWYARNAVSAVKFAIFSSRYNEIAEGRSDRVGPARRVVVMVGDLAGWPITATAAMAALAGLAWGSRGRGNGGESGPDGARALAHLHFTRMAWLGAGTAAAILLCPSYFDARFLLPIWPALAIDLGTRLRSLMSRLDTVPKVLVGFGLAASVLAACVNVAREPVNPTYWKTAGLIDDLVGRFGISNLVNVGNRASWNVCKTGLINELRAEPGNCFVLHDMTKLSADRARQRLSHADAVVVLARSDLDQSILRSSPGLNRGYDAMVKSLNEDPRFLPVALPETYGLPHLLVYVRSGRIDSVERTSKAKGVDRR